MKGTSFPESTFKYTTFSSSQLDDTILDNHLPVEENLARDFVRALRVNFSQVGNYEAVNKAALIEVKLTGKHLYKAAYSREKYYRKKDKYTGIGRIKAIVSHIIWKFSYLFWGDGESIWRIFISSIVFVLFVSFFITITSSNTCLDTIISVIYNFFGVEDLNITKPYIAVLTVGRLLLFGALVSVFVKKRSKR